MHNHIKKTGNGLKIKAFLGLSVLLLTVTTYNGCSAKSASALVMSDAKEATLGKEFHEQLIDSAHTYPIYRPITLADTQFVEYVEGVFRDVLSSVPKEDEVNYGFTFTIIDTNIQNAFAVPGGYIYIYTGIIKSMKNESEMAGVMGHEIAHVTQHHYRRSIVGQTAINALIDALVGSESQLSLYVKAGFGILAGTYMSQDHESESDEVGTVYLADTKRNPRGIASFFKRMEGSTFRWFNLTTHPEPEKRVIAVNEQVDENSAWSSFDTDEKKFASRFMERTQVIR